MSALKLLQVVVVARDLPEKSLRRGMRGTIVDIYEGPPPAYELEIVDDEGRTVFLGAVDAEDVHPDFSTEDTCFRGDEDA